MSEEDKKEIREYIDLVYKPKKLGIKNMDREIIIYKIETLLKTQTDKLKEKAMEIKYAKHNPLVNCECEDCRVANKILELLN